LNNLLKARDNLRLVLHLAVGFLYSAWPNDELKPFPVGQESVWQKTKQRRSTNWHKSLHNQSVSRCVGLSVGRSVPRKFPFQFSPSCMYIYHICPNLYSVQPSLHVNRWAKNLLTQLFGACRRLPSFRPWPAPLSPQLASPDHSSTLQKMLHIYF